ncbi:MAG: ferrochelatase, partial [Candidatus Eisenbacteria bacterium]|nr:ferrochelatase [Candidatus Eisenbacteria bacterium]
GEKRALALPLYPHECRATTGSSLADLGAARDRVAPAMTIDIVHSYHEHPGYVAALVGRIAEALDRHDEEDRAEAVLLFSAHGVPERLARRGDPYVRQIRETVDAVMHSLEGTLGRRPEHRLGFQSRVGPVRWVGPGTDEVIRSLAGRRCVLAIPVAFVSDHIETLYEIDMLFGEEARRAGIARFARVPSLNSDPAFLDALAAIAIGAFEAAEERAGARAEGGAGARAGRGGTEAREGERRR